MGPRVATCQSRNDWIQASTSGMSIRPGWVDPNAASSLEYLHRGNTALAGLQYSYLPSWISFLVDKDEAAEAGIALYRHVHRRWGPAPGRGPPQAGHLRREPGPLRRRGGRGSTARRRWPTWSPGRTGRCSPAPPPPTTSGTSSPTTASPAPRSGARSTPAAPASSSPTGPPTWNGPTRPGGTSRAVRAPSLGPGGERHRRGLLEPPGMDRPAPELRHPRPGRLVPDRHRHPGGRRPHRRLQRHLPTE
jgi:hypothetical protein